MDQRAERPVDRSVRLPADLAEQLDEEARLQDSTVGTIIRQAVRSYLAARQAERAANAAPFLDGM